MAFPTIINREPSPPPSQAKHPPSSHRLPTVSASQVLQTLQDTSSNFLPTGLGPLDTLLAGNSDGSSVNGGLERGKVTEIWGPSGSGKTAIALQVAANVISNDSTAMWVDATRPISAARLQSVISATEPPSTPRETPLKMFHHSTVPTLSHLLALVLNPRMDSFPPDLSLLVIDGLDSLINLDYPRYQSLPSNKPEQQKWQAGRRYAILGSVASALNKLAVLHNMAVVVTTSCSTRMRSESGLGVALVPGVGGAEWDSGVWNRLAVFRDFCGRFVGVQKRQGKSLVSREEVGEAGKMVCFDIATDGRLRERQTDRPTDGAMAAVSKPRLSPVKAPSKRQFDEIADSEEEDVDEYGWIDADEHALAIEGLVNETQSIETGANT